MPLPRVFCKGALLFVLTCPSFAARAEWRQTETSVAWLDGTNALWQFTFDPARGKPFFHPLSVAGGASLTNFKPEDHPWHYGLWLSWKYINGVNYWEEDRTTGRAEGSTRWTPPGIETRTDGSATIRMNVNYANPTGRVDLAETRVLEISKKGNDGGYTIDWHSRFVAGPQGAELGRTPMPGEPGGQVNGGYAGLGLRLAAPPLDIAFLSSTGRVERFASDRARPNASAVACNFSRDATPAGGIAIFSDPANAGATPPWYIVNSAQMRFVCAAILAPEVLRLAPGETLNLRYRIAVRASPWTVETLREESGRGGVFGTTP